MKTLFTLSTLIFYASVAHAVISLTSPTSVFRELSLNGDSDPYADNQANRTDIELVGDAGLGLSAFYFGFNDHGNTSNQDGDLFFRVRVAGESGSPDGVLNGYVTVGFDVESDGVMDYYVRHGANLTGNDQQIAIFDASATAANNSPVSIELGSQRYITGNVTAMNSQFRDVDDVTIGDTFSNTVYSRTTSPILYTERDIDGLGDTDKFLTFSFAFDELVQIIQADYIGTPYAGFNDQSTLSLILSTSQNSNNINSDIAGRDGVTSDPFIPGGGITDPIQVPEPSTAALIAAVFIFGFVSARRHR
ncbi:MAG TPA: hypothetical protein DCX06_11095 [Opitutae bacterium]|nr:hypothetical protein [Opitutae bacterium]